MFWTKPELNGALATSTNPQATLEAFVQSLGASETIRFRHLGTDLDIHPADVQTPLGPAPDWFVRLLAVPEFKAAFPVTIEGKQVGDIVFAPDLSADVYEKWIGFLAIACSGIILMLLTAARATPASPDQAPMARPRSALWNDEPMIARLPGTSSAPAAP